MSPDSLKSLSHFSLPNQIKLVIGLLIKPLFRNNERFQILLKEKHQLDFIYRCNREVRKLSSNEILITGNRNVKYDYQFHLRRYTSDIDVYKQIYYRPDYPRIIDKIKEIFGGVENVKKIIDGGAYTGLSTFYWAKSFPKSQVVAIEAEKSNFDLLRKNVQINNLSNADVYNKAIWSNEEQLCISREKMDKRPWAFAVEIRKNQQTDEVSGISLSKLRTDLSIDKIDILKLDIEGAEREVFLEDNKISEVLENTKVIICELHYFDETKDAILKKIIDFGYSVSTIGEDHFFINQKYL